MSNKVVKAWNEGDYEGFMTFFDDSAILLPQNAPSIIGVQSIASLYSNSFETFTLKVNNTIDEIYASGDYAYEIGAWVGSMNPKDGSTPIEFNNKVLCFCKRQVDGSWKGYRWMYNTNDVPEELHLPEIP